MTLPDSDAGRSGSYALATIWATMTHSAPAAKAALNGTRWMVANSVWLDSENTASPWVSPGALPCPGKCFGTLISPLRTKAAVTAST